ncbi:uncharacterized protein zgc:113314 isoform X1 [Cyprinus carpio]|uniref:Uncharacterized LOC109096729 n=2 Tax=Cyprinus carpio TaxID=7962 RepID=A0A8C1KZK7_CYPCA|nr:uncharacterized protein zgc:113314 isoform X1 [Cyprinus carpio]XP_018965908.1 uncharacterized protein zgc:113314 isoform X1 [Cyprinus carpio]XP_018965909.1 uncharacterized protein zgc:113314 isoform X1 [Cyprinus carpio]
MGILIKSIRNLRDSPRNGQDVMSTWETKTVCKTVKIEYDRTSEPFTKPEMSTTIVNRLRNTLGSKQTFLQKQNTLDNFNIITDLATQLNRVTAKVSGESQSFNVVDDLSLEECKGFIFRWSKELKCLRSKYKNNMGKISTDGKFRSLEALNIKKHQDQTLKYALKDFQWLICILMSLPKSSVCQEGCARVELLNLYRQWKKGQLVNMLPIMDFIMKTLLKEKDFILIQKPQNRSDGKRLTVII